MKVGVCVFYFEELVVEVVGGVVVVVDGDVFLEGVFDCVDDEVLGNVVCFDGVGLYG